MLRIDKVIAMSVVYCFLGTLCRSTKTSFCQPERKFGWTCDETCNVPDVAWLTVIIFHSVCWRDVTEPTALLVLHCCSSGMTVYV